MTHDPAKSGAEESEVYGLMGEFASPEALLAACQALHAQGYTRLDAYSPFPIEGLGEALGFASGQVQGLTFVGGLIGAVCGYGLQYWVNLYAYPLNIGGRPLNSVPSFIPITFEVTVLFAALTAVFSMLALNGLPRLYHPVFNLPQFARASRDAFFLCVERSDPRFNRRTVAEAMQRLGATEVQLVEA